MKKYVWFFMGIILSLNVFSQTEKWGYLAINHQDSKEYVITKLKQTNGIRYMGYCSDHQLVLFKFDVAVFNKVSDIYAELITVDASISNLLVQKFNANDENVALEFINLCSFDETSATNIKNELNKN
ncbi:MAG: hypothetical protein AB1304_00860 [Bacteroidota bacterium]